MVLISIATSYYYQEIIIFCFNQNTVLNSYLIKYQVSLAYIIFSLSGILFSYSVLILIKRYTNQKRFLAYLSKLLVISLIIYSIFLVIITLKRYFNYSSESIDVAYFRSVVWQLSQFKIPYIWENQRFVWGDHFHPILILLVPFFWISQNSSILMFIQVATTISGVIPIYLICQNKFNFKPLSLSLCLAFLLFGGMQQGFAYGFHEILLIPPFLLFAYYFLEKNKLNFYYIFIILSLMVKEELAFVTLFFGIYFFLFKKRYKEGLITIIISLLWYFLCFHLIFPYFNQNKSFAHLGQYGELGGNGILSLLSSVFTKPLLFFNSLITPSGKIQTIFHSFGSIAFIPFIFPPSLILVIPSLIEKLLSSGIAWQNGFHYSTVIWVVIIISTIESLNYKFLRISKKLILLKKLYFSLLILFVAFFSNLYFGYKQISIFYLGEEVSLSKNHINKLNNIIKTFPKNSSVSAQYQIAPHITKPYGKLHAAPFKNETADYVIIDRQLPLVLTTKKKFENYLIKIQKEQNYKPIINDDGIIVFAKKSKESF